MFIFNNSRINSFIYHIYLFTSYGRLYGLRLTGYGLQVIYIFYLFIYRLRAALRVTAYGRVTGQWISNGFSNGFPIYFQ